MPSTANVSQTSFFNIQNAQIPREGPKALGATLNFFAGNFAALVDLTQNQLQGQISFIQGVFVDNSQSSIALVMQVQGSTNQRLVFPAGTQTYCPVLAQNPPVFTFTGAGNASPNCLVPVFFFNVPLPALELGASAAQGFTFAAGNLLVQDTSAESSLAALTALIASGGLNVNVLTGGGGGGFAGPMTWHGVNVSSGATVYTPAAGKRFYINNIKVYMDPGATSTAGSNNFAIQDGASFVIQIYWQTTTTPPTFTGATGPILLFSADDMGWLSSAVNNTVIFTINHNVSANGLWMDFSTLTGDHV